VPTITCGTWSSDSGPALPRSRRGTVPGCPRRRSRASATTPAARGSRYPGAHQESRASGSKISFRRSMVADCADVVALELGLHAEAQGRLSPGAIPPHSAKSPMDHWPVTFSEVRMATRSDTMRFAVEPGLAVRSGFQKPLDFPVGIVERDALLSAVLGSRAGACRSRTPGTSRSCPAQLASSRRERWRSPCACSHRARTGRARRPPAWAGFLRAGAW